VGDGDVQGFREHQQLKIAHAAATDFNLGDAGTVNVRSQAQDAICQFLLGEPKSRSQSRLADTRTDDVLASLSKSLRCFFHNE
jgi:hypothetical protein